MTTCDLTSIKERGVKTAISTFVQNAKSLRIDGNTVIAEYGKTTSRGKVISKNATYKMMERKVQAVDKWAVGHYNTNAAVGFVKLYTPPGKVVAEFKMPKALEDMYRKQIEANIKAAELPNPSPVVPRIDFFNGDQILAEQEAKELDLTEEQRIDLGYGFQMNGQNPFSFTDNRSPQAKDATIKYISGKLEQLYGVRVQVLEGPQPFKGRWITNSDGIYVYQISRENATIDTPLHEIIEPFILAVAKSDPGVLDTLFNQLKNIPAFRDAISKIKAIRPELDDLSLKVEVITQAIGEKAALRMDSEFNKKGVIAALAKFFRAMRDAILRMFDTITFRDRSFASIDENTTLDKITNLLVAGRIKLNPSPEGRVMNVAKKLDFISEGETLKDKTFGYAEARRIQYELAKELGFFGSASDRVAVLFKHVKGTDNLVIDKIVNDPTGKFSNIAKKQLDVFENALVDPIEANVDEEIINDPNFLDNLTGPDINYDLNADPIPGLTIDGEKSTLFNILMNFEELTLDNFIARINSLQGSHTTVKLLNHLALTKYNSNATVKYKDLNKPFRLGEYDPSSNTLYINSGFQGSIPFLETLIDNFTHEIIHAKSTRVLYLFSKGEISQLSQEELEFAKKVNKKYQKAVAIARETFPDLDTLVDSQQAFYGFKNIYEFTSEILTNKEFISLINEIDKASKIIPGYFKRIQNIFEDVINAILEFFNISYRIGDRESAFQVFSKFFEFQDTDHTSEAFKISNPELTALGLDIAYVDKSNTDLYFAQVLLNNLTVQIKQFEELVRNAETFEEIEQRAYYERELAQRRTLYTDLKNMIEVNEYKNAIETFIKSSKERIENIYNDINTFTNQELTTASARNKIYLLKSYLDALGPVTNNEGGVKFDYDIPSSDLIAHENYERDRANAEATMDDFDFGVWLAQNPDPTTMDIVFNNLQKLAANSKFLLQEKAYPAIADWLASDITDEDLVALDEVYRDEVDAIMKSGYTDQKKLELIKNLRVARIASDRDLFLTELQNSLQTSVFNGGSGMKAYDTLLHPTINNSDLAMSLFAKKFKLKFEEARNKSANISQELISATQKFKNATGKLGNVISPESFFKKIVVQGEHGGLTRFKLISEYNKEAFYKNRKESFEQYAQEYESAIQLIDQDYNNSIASGVDPLMAMVVRSNALSQAKSNQNKKIRKWYEDNTIAYTQQELEDIINLQRDTYTNNFDLFIDSIKQGVTDPVKIARIDEVAKRFRDFRTDRAIDRISAEQQFSSWYKTEKTKPDFREIVERVRNQFDYFENQYEDWFKQNIGLNSYSGEFMAKGKLIKLASKYLVPEYQQLSTAEKEYLDVLKDVNTRWQNKLPASERLPEDFLPIVPKETGIATPFTSLPAEKTVAAKIIKGFKGIGGIARMLGRGFLDLFKSSFSDSTYRKTVNNLKDFQQTLGDTPARKTFPIYYTNIGNKNIKLEDIESNPLTSLIKATIMANEYDARSDIFSEIQLFDYMMENRNMLSSEDVEDYLKNNTLDYSENFGDIPETVSVLNRNRTLGKRILGGLIKFFWVKDQPQQIQVNDPKDPTILKDLSVDEILSGIDGEFKRKQLGERNLTKENKDRFYQKGITSKFATSQWEFFKNSQLFGSEKRNPGVLSGIGDSLLYWKSLVGLAGNFYSATNTLSVGTLNNLINSATGNEYGKRNLLIGFLKANVSMSGLFVANNAGLNSGKLSAMARYLFEHLDILQGESYRRMTDRTSLEVQAIKIINSPIAKLGFGMQSYTEGFIALQTAYAVMERIKVPASLNTFGKEVSLSKMYDFDPNTGHITPSANFTGTKEEFFKLEQKMMGIVHKVMKENQGVYDSFNRIQLSDTIVGRFMLQFRKFVVPALDKRTQRFKIDVETMQYKKGYYTGTLDVLARKGILRSIASFGASIVNGITLPFGTNILTDKNNPLRLSKLERSSVNSFMMERAIVMALNTLSSALLAYAVTSKGETPDEDDDLGDKTNSGLAFALFYLRRARMEITSITDPNSYLTMLTTIPVTDQAFDLYKLAIESGKIAWDYIDNRFIQGKSSEEASRLAKNENRYQRETGKAKKKLTKVQVPNYNEYGNVVGYEEVQIEQLPTRFEIAAKDVIPGYSNIWMVGNPVEKYNSLRRYEPKGVIKEIFKKDEIKSGGSRRRGGNSDAEKQDREPVEREKD